MLTTAKHTNIENNVSVPLCCNIVQITSTVTVITHLSSAPKEQTGCGP